MASRTRSLWLAACLTACGVGKSAGPPPSASGSADASPDATSSGCDPATCPLKTCHKGWLPENRPGECCLKCKQIDCSSVDCRADCGLKGLVLECCETCKPATDPCLTAKCESPYCKPGSAIYTPPGECCPACYVPPPDPCASVKCEPPYCAPGSALYTPPGECCQVCYGGAAGAAGTGAGGAGG